VLAQELRDSVLFFSESSLQHCRQQHRLADRARPSSEAR